VTWTGVPWDNGRSVGLRGASHLTLGIIFQHECHHELYLAVEHDENYDPILTLLNITNLPTVAEKQREKEAARFAAEEIASQEQLLQWLPGRQTRSRKRARQDDEAKADSANQKTKKARK
jgi:hypothetical protein